MAAVDARARGEPRRGPTTPRDAGERLTRNIAHERPGEIPPRAWVETGTERGRQRARRARARREGGRGRVARGRAGRSREARRGAEGDVRAEKRRTVRPTRSLMRLPHQSTRRIGSVEPSDNAANHASPPRSPYGFPVRVVSSASHRTPSPSSPPPSCRLLSRAFCRKTLRPIYDGGHGIGCGTARKNAGEVTP